MDRILRNGEATLRNTWYADGVAVDPGAVTVDVVAADGTVVEADGPVTGGGAAARAYTLSPELNVHLGILTLTWKSATRGERETQADVAGGFYFAIAELRAEYPDLADVDDYPAAKIAKKRQSAEDRIEKMTHFAGVPRAKRFPLSGDGSSSLMLPVHYPRRVLAGTIGADVLDLDEVALDPISVNRDLTWPAGHRNVSLLVEHGLDSPPEALREAAMMLTFHLLTPGPLDERTTAIQGEDGRIELLATPGRHGSLTGIPEVDSRISDEVLSDPRQRLVIR